MAIAERIGIAEAGHYVAFYGQGATEVKLMRAPTPAGGMKVGAYAPRESFLLSYARMSHYSLEMVDLARRGDQTAKNTLQRIGVDVRQLPLTTYELATQILRAGNAPRKEDLSGLVDMAASGDAAALNMLGEKYPPNSAFEFDFSMQVAMNQAVALRGKVLAMLTTATLVSSMGRPEVATPGGVMTNVDSAIFAFAGLALANSANSKPLAAQLERYLARLTPAERGALDRTSNR